MSWQGDIASVLSRSRYTSDKWKSMIDAIYAYYLESLQKGYKVFSTSGISKDGTPIKYVQQQTEFPLEDIIFVLRTLEQWVSQGKVKREILDPHLQKTKEKTGLDVFTNITHTTTDVFNKLLIVGGVIGGVYVLSIASKLISAFKPGK